MKNPSTNRLRFILFFATLLISGAGLTLFFLYERADTAEKKKILPTGLLVSVVETHPRPSASQIEVFGQVVPDKQATLSSLISGKIVYVSDRLKKGMIVEQGELLAKIDNTPYVSKLFQTRLSLANAKLNLLREEQEADEAKASWKRSGLKGDPKSPLVLRKPQLETARKMVAAETAALKASQKELEYCEIRSPFKGLVTEHFVNLGECVSSGDQIAVLFSTDKAEIEIRLDEKQWELLDEVIENSKIKLFDETRQTTWNARIIRDGKRILPESRLRQLFCEVINPLDLDPPLLAGTFLTVRISGRTIPGLIKLPESCVTKKGLVWYTEEKVQKNEFVLNNFEADAAFYKNGFVFLYPPRDLAFPLSITLYPNTAFVSGLKVRPRPQAKEG